MEVSGDSKGRPGSWSASARSTSPSSGGAARPGWQFDEASARFLSGEGEEVFEPNGLPEGSQIVHMVPDLGTALRSQLSDAEAELARFLHILLPPGSQAAKIAPGVGKWPCLEEVRLPPEVSLPTEDPVSPGA